ncbi:SAM-dependent methyltransferase [Streptomyces broussonetiae]|uniref:SAM-dependent methyltransferase n=2 Tax=Streptomyces broussonetiae TaxID=2686304 RepID=A0ABV5EAQ1_9ACTN
MLLGTLGTAPAAPAGTGLPTATTCPGHLAEKARCYSGQDANGAYYTMAVPKRWNGSLVVHAHGGPDFSYDASTPTEDLERWAVMVDEGYAWAASSYRRGGYGVRMAAADTENVRRLFADRFARPERTYLHGQSWGGNVAAKVTETHGSKRGDHGIRQWLDIGTGIPTEPNLHQVAQAVAPEALVVYADNDPLVLKYAERLMRSTPQGRTTYIEADINDPEALLNAPELAEVLDLDQPVALSLNAVLHFVPDAQDPYGIVNRLRAALPSGSALALSHCTPDFDPETWRKVTDFYQNAGTPGQVRSKAEVARFFEGLDLIDPGIVIGHRWRPDTEPTASDAEVSTWAAVGIKP